MRPWRGYGSDAARLTQQPVTSLGTGPDFSGQRKMKRRISLPSLRLGCGVLPLRPVVRHDY